MYEERLKDLLERHLSNKITEVELDELFDLLDSTSQSTQERLLQEYFNTASPPKYRLTPDRKELLYQKLKDTLIERVESTINPPTFLQRYLSWTRYAAVAAVVLILLVTVHVVRKNLIRDAASTFAVIDSSDNNINDIYLENDGVPHLRLANGEVQSLEKNYENQLAELGVYIQHTETGETVYRVQDLTDAFPSSKQEYIVFSTPKGQTSQIVLHDGTTIWLNSGSSLSYPTVFSDKERRVRLVGEAYFDVAPNKNKPFNVETEQGGLIRVLGTQFNLKAYRDEKTVTTTLVEGAVEFKINKQIVYLNPEDQVAADLNVGSIHKRKVNVSEYTSWKDGYFSFNQQSIAQILEAVQRWYNIEEITYEHLSEEKFSGTFKRTKSLKSLLTKLERISNAKFLIKEKRIVVTQ